MADIKKRVPYCDNDAEGERGKRGHRGHRGHEGPRGPTGPSGDFRVPFLRVSDVSDLCRARGSLIGSRLIAATPLGTQIAAGSNGVVLPTPVINVGSTAAFLAAGQIVFVTSAGDQLVTYTGKTATTFTGCTGGTGTMSLGQSVAQATTLTAPSVLPDSTIDVVSTAGFPAPAGTTTIAPNSNGEVLPQSEIAVADTTGFLTLGFALVTTSAGVQRVSYTGLTPGVPGVLTGCYEGIGTMVTGGAVVAASRIQIASDTVPIQSVTYTGVTPTTFTGCTGGTGTAAIGTIVRPLKTNPLNITGEWGLDLGFPARSTGSWTPAEIAGIKWDAVIAAVLTDGALVPIGPHAHGFTDFVATSITVTPNTAIPPIVDNSSIVITGTVTFTNPTFNRPLTPFTITLARLSQAATFRLDMVGTESDSALTGAVVESTGC